MKDSNLVSSFDIKLKEEQYTSIVGTYLSKIKRRI